MINFMQVNKRTRKTNLILDIAILDELIKFLNVKEPSKVSNKLEYYASRYKIEKQVIIRHLLKYIIHNNNIYDKKILDLLDLINHSQKNLSFINDYCVLELFNFLNYKKLI